MENELSELIVLVGGTAITLGLAYIPGVKGWWENLEGERKRLVLGLLYILVAVGLYIPSCFGGPELVVCDVSSIWDTLGAALVALIASQGVYTFLPTAKKREMDSGPPPGNELLAE